MHSTIQESPVMPGGPTGDARSDGGSRAPRFGFQRLLHDLWHKRRRHRQFAGVALVLLFTAVGTPSRAGWAAGTAVVVLGMLVRLWASGVVVKNEVLATTGPYAFVRHPLYVGNVLIGLGFCLASGLWWSWPAFLALFVYFYPHTIRYEDRKLHRLFGEPWERWERRTRALVPRLTPYRDRAALPGSAPSGARWSLRLSLARNGEPIHVLVGALFLWYLHAQLPVL